MVNDQKGKFSREHRAVLRHLLRILTVSRHIGISRNPAKLFVRKAVPEFLAESILVRAGHQA